MKRHSNGIPNMFLYALINNYQTKRIINHAGTDTRYTAGDSYNHTIHLCKNDGYYDLLVVNNKQETTTTNFDDPQAVEDEISENCNIIDTSGKRNLLQFINLVSPLLVQILSRENF